MSLRFCLHEEGVIGTLNVAIPSSILLCMVLLFFKAFPCLLDSSIGETVATFFSTVLTYSLIMSQDS